MYSITIQNDITNAVNWALDHFGGHRFNIQNEFPSTDYTFTFYNIDNASHFALKWGGKK
jgi:hypothetical protein